MCNWLQSRGYDSLYFWFIHFQAQLNSPYGGVVAAELDAHAPLRRFITYPCFFFARMTPGKHSPSSTAHLLPKQ